MLKNSSLKKKKKPQCEAFADGEKTPTKGLLQATDITLKAELEEDAHNLPFFTGDSFQDFPYPQWMPETTRRTEPYVDSGFSCTCRCMKKLTL